MVIGLMIGSGIFSTPAKILKLSGSVGMSLILWLVGGLLTLCGTLCYVELGTMMVGIQF